MTESLQENITRMEAELEEMRSKLDKGAERNFKVGDKVFIEGTVATNFDDGDLAISVMDWELDVSIISPHTSVVHLQNEGTIKEPVKDKYVVISTTGHRFDLGTIVTPTDNLLCYEDENGLDQYLNASDVMKIKNPDYLDTPELPKTPCQELGYTVGDHFVKTGGELCYGEVCVLTADDGTDCPRFDVEGNYHYLDLEHMIKLNK